MAYKMMKYGEAINATPTNANAINYTETETVADAITSLNDTITKKTAFPNFSRLLKDGNLMASSYTATEDCYICGYMANNGTQANHRAEIVVNGISTGIQHWNYGSNYGASPFSLFIRKGDVISMNVLAGSFYSGVFKAFSLQ